MVDIEELKLFVPGRIGLIGELSDLVSPYLSFNKNLVPGQAISCAIDKGIYSKAKKHNDLIYKFNDLEFHCPIEKELLLKEAQSENFTSYICGTVLYMIENFEGLMGIEILIEKMDLPIKKGLASSAAICLTIVKSYNKLYNLNMTSDEMALAAYFGEHLAGSKCGKLDQFSILNNNCSKLTFYKDNVDLKSVFIKKNLYFLIVDLNANKNTRIIMNAFNKALSNGNTKKDKALLGIVGEQNVMLVEKSVEALQNGDLELFGKCLKEAQVLLDNAICACSEFKAPFLHLVLNDGFVKNFSYGGKSIGSGGDGSLLLLCKDEQSQLTLKSYIKEVYSMNTICFCLKKSS